VLHGADAPVYVKFEIPHEVSEETMTRITHIVSLAAVVAGLALPHTVRAQKAGKPTVAILYFNNNVFSKDARDFDGLSKGVPDFLVTEMAANPNIRVIERDQVQRLLDEHKMITGGQIDRETAVKVGVLLGAQHMIFGGFMGDPKGNFRIDARAVNVETGEIEYTERVQDQADNIMPLIGRLAEKMNAGMKLPTMPRRTGDAHPAGAAATGAQQAGAIAPTVKLPMRVAVMYGKALDLKDHKDPRAAELFRAVLKEFPDFGPATQELNKLKGT
jgi:TolB-like protein